VDLAARFTFALCMLGLTQLGCGPADAEDTTDAGATPVDAAQDAGQAHDSAAGPDTGAATDSAVATDAARPDAGGGHDAGLPQGVELNQGWIGGACGNAGDCVDVTSATCETADFPAGMCTVDCDIYCPDAPGGVGAGTGNTMTRCIVDDQGNGRCVGGCDFDQSPTGCRPGYTCVLRQRDGQPDSIFPVCLPADVQRWPGEPAPTGDIGTACSSAQDCEHLSCLGLPGGYCVKTMCDLAGCPTGSTCFTFQGGDTTACLDQCGGDGDCRQGAGHFCDTDGVCWAEAPESHPLWDPSVGPADCAAALAAGLSGCDSSVDSYVVVNKSARNLALCDSSGDAIENFSAGLGDAPVGDKEVQGDERTPEGVFYVSYTQEVTSLGRAWLLSYPDSGDAARGLNGGLITQGEHDAIVSAQNSCGIPPSGTTLGGAIEIHGLGGESDWTNGCVAIDDTDTAILWMYLGVGDTIVVLP